MRNLINAIFCVLRSGCPWRMVPDRFAPQTTAVTYANSFSTRMSEKGRTSPFRGECGKVRLRRVSPVAAQSGDRPLSEPTAGTQPCRPETLFMPRSRPQSGATGGIASFTGIPDGEAVREGSVWSSR